jgi:hypothetical protein
VVYLQYKTQANTTQTKLCIVVIITYLLHYNYDQHTRFYS